MWDLSGYVKSERVVGGLSCLVGGSFACQEPSSLFVKDENFMKTVVSEAAKNNIILSKNRVVNSSEQLQGWNQYAMHLVARYDFGVHSAVPTSPILELECDCPLTGKRAFSTTMYGGSVGLRFSFDF